MFEWIGVCLHPPVPCDAQDRTSWEVRAGTVPAHTGLRKSMGGPDGKTVTCLDMYSKTPSLCVSMRVV